uniref:uS12 prolyl 3-hydroxylase n=1 Tax=Echinococcus granulosus TaxID=6210 RepID=A0A068WL69_ECHGR|nr:2 oxoglutarate and iron dependent oxygenase [Echinococcus granulosus]
MRCSFSINPKYADPDFQRLFLEIFRSPEGKTMESGDGVKIIHSPFTCAVLPNFLETAEICALEVEARKFPLNRRLNDLFSLNQSGDLKGLCKSAKLAGKFPLLCQMREFLASDMLQWMKAVTGSDLDEGEVSSTISLYEPNDYLLCHDDELERRRIAFIIYLVPEDWDVAMDGGTLDLYESGPTPGCNVVPPGSGDYHPWRVVRSLPPGRNCLAFFEVCSKSFHQVAEVIGKRDRLSIHGWYMSDPLPRVPRSRDPVRIPRLPPCFIEEELLFKWLSPTYIDLEQLKVIRRRFISTSEIQLRQFFRESSWERLCKAILSAEEAVWLHEGPMDLRNVSVLPYATEAEVAAKLPLDCHEVRRLFTSEAMLLLLSQMTGIRLHPLARCGAEKAEEVEDDNGSEAKRSRFEETTNTEVTAPRFHRWCAGMYTLLADAESGVIAATAPDGGVSTWRLDLFYHVGGYGCKLGEKAKAITESATGGNNSGISNSSDGNNQLYWQDCWNGQIIYVSRTDNEELLRVQPEDNALTLVYCDAADSAKFVRYLNVKAAPLALPGASTTTPSFAYDVAVSYFHEDDEADDDDSEEGDGEVEDDTSSDEEEEESLHEAEDNDSHSDEMEAAT